MTEIRTFDELMTYLHGRLTGISTRRRFITLRTPIFLTIRLKARLVSAPRNMPQRGTRDVQELGMFLDVKRSKLVRPVKWTVVYISGI